MYVLLQVALTLLAVGCQAAVIDTPVKYPCYDNSQSVELQVKSACIFSHNKVRADHGVAALKWNNNIAANAKAWAENMAKKGKMYHSTSDERNGWGENLAWFKVNMATDKFIVGPANAVCNWYNEIENYDFAAGKSHNGGVVGHFTQVVWAGTKEVGCGVSTVVDGNVHETYVACQYKPAGNMGGQYVANVKPSAKITTHKPFDLEQGGCCDFSSICPTYGSYCEQYSFLKSYCSVTCKEC